MSENLPNSPDEEIDEELDEEVDFEAICQQCEKKASDSRFCPYCGHDKAKYETFADAQSEKMEEAKRVKLYQERLGRLFFILFGIHLLGLIRYWSPYGEIPYFLLVSYMAILLNFTEGEFRYFILKKPAPKFYLAFFGGLLWGGGLYASLSQLHLSPGNTLLLWQTPFWLVVHGVGFPLLFFGVFQPTLEKLVTSKKKNLLLTLLAFSSITFLTSWKLFPFFGLLGFYLSKLRNKSGSLQPLVFSNVAMGICFLILEFLL